MGDGERDYCVEGVSELTNNEAMAYATVAMKELGYKMAQIKAVRNEMYYQFDILTEAEAGKEADNILKR